PSLRRFRNNSVPPAPSLGRGILPSPYARPGVSLFARKRCRPTWCRCFGGRRPFGAFRLVGPVHGPSPRSPKLFYAPVTNINRANQIAGQLLVPELRKELRPKEAVVAADGPSGCERT